ncbi:MAG: VWA domain-containing protein [Deltaproteobacteria bacterium]|nr:VWA domain-containing protein [Deltaproteobacteria bacterium]
MACSIGGGGSSGGGDNSKPNIALSESDYDFSGVVVNNSADHTFVVTNEGDADLDVGQISADDTGYSIPAGSDACSNRTLGPYDTCTFEARFEPPYQNPQFSGQVSIPSNDPTGTATIDLLGEGYGLNVWIKNAGAEGCVVDVGITVTDDEGNILDDGDLDPNNDFSLYVNGIAAAPGDVTFDAYETPSPVSVVLAIDCSTSEGGVIEQIRTGAQNFIDQLNDADEAAICKFTSATEFYPDPEIFYDILNHKADLINYINGLSAASGTHLYDAVYESIDRAADGIITNKHLVVVLSDGVDTGSDKTLNQVITHAEEEGVAIFTIYYRDPNFEGGDYGDPNTLRQSADGTGGQDYDGMTGDLDTVYYKIVSTIRNKFIFELTIPDCTPGTASLDVVVDTGVLHGKDSITITFP